MNNEIKINDKIVDLSTKFNQNEWSAIERKFNPFELKVLECLKLLGTTNNYVVKQDYTVLGDELYLSNRKLLETPIELVTKINETPKNETKKKKEKPMTSAEKIIFENSKTRAKSRIELVLKSFNGEFNPKYAFNEEIVELRGIGLLYAGYYLFTNNTQFRKKKHLPFVFTVMISIERFMNNCKNLEGKSLTKGTEYVSKTLLNDLNVWLEKLKTIYTYDGMAITDYAPELLVFTEYDKAIPSTGIKPRKHQIELMNTIKENFNTGFLLSYNPPMGSGKTTSLVAICNYVDILRKNSYPNMQVIFVCNLPSVREHAASLCYNAGIKFGIGSKESGLHKYKITNHFTCTNSDRLVIITSPDVAYEILKENSENIDNYLVMNDEPTAMADNPESETLDSNMAFLTVTSPRTILCSATLPPLEMMPHIKQYFEQKYKNIVMKIIYSNEIQIGCDVKTFDMELVVPHLGASTQEQLKDTIDTIKKNPFLGRTYTSTVVRALYKNMKEKVTIPIPDVNVVFQNVADMTSDKIRELAMELLETLSNCSNDIINDICSSDAHIEQIELKNIEEDVKEKKKVSIFDDDDDDDNNIDQEDNNKHTIDFKKLATTDAHIMLNTTLIATPNPMDWVQENFYDFVRNDIYNSTIHISETNSQHYKSTETILNLYEKESDFIEKQIEAFEKSLDNYDKKKDRESKKRDDDTEKRNDGTDKETTKSYGNTDKATTREEIEKKLYDLTESKPKLKFPEWAHINSLKHIKKYAKNKVKELYGKNLRIPPTLELIPWKTFNISDELLTLLFAGVGVYSMNDPNICPNYLKTVLEMASNGSLAYIVADVSICFGTNYPINKVVVTEEFSTKHSINTLFQLFGRAGRVGKSWVAVIYIPKSVVKKLLDYTQDKSCKHVIEATNMENVFNENITKTKICDTTQLSTYLSKYMEDEVENVIPTSTNEPMLSFKKFSKLDLSTTEKLSFSKTEITIESTIADKTIVASYTETKIKTDTKTVSKTDVKVDCAPISNQVLQKLEPKTHKSQNYKELSYDKPEKPYYNNSEKFREKTDKQYYDNSAKPDRFFKKNSSYNHENSVQKPYEKSQTFYVNDHKEDEKPKTTGMGWRKKKAE
jgi:hypothetical protein